MFLGFGFRCLYQRGKFHFFVLRAFDSTVHGNAVTVSTASVLEPKQRPAFVIQNLGTNVAGKWFDTSQVWSLVSVPDRSTCRKGGVVISTLVLRSLHPTLFRART